MYYLFSPLIGEDGKQVVRRIKRGEYYYDAQEFLKCAAYLSVKEYPVVVLQKFEEDPFKDLRDAYNRLTPDMAFYETRPPNPQASLRIMWQAIVKTMEGVEGK